MSDQPTQRPAARMLAAGALALALLAACAGNPPKDEAAQAPKGDRAAAGQLYAGKPAIVHATEFPVESAAEGIARGDEAWRLGKLDLAVYLYVQSIAYDAESPEPFLKIGSIHERLGNKPLAARAFALAVERDPDNAGANERLGLLYLAASSDEAATKHLQKAVELDPSRWQSQEGLGILAERRSEFSAAIAHFDTANRLEPRAATVVSHRGHARYLAGDYAGAETDLRLAISLGAPAGAWTGLARSQARQGRYEEAQESLLKETDAAHAFNELGKLALDDGDPVRARDYFNDAISTAPRYFEAAVANLALANERIEEAGRHPKRVTTDDAKVFAKGAYVGQVARGREVDVLHAQGTYSLVRYREADGSQKTGWVASAILTEQSALR
jgi:Tfp pilus assembly protein PilF